MTDEKRAKLKGTLNGYSASALEHIANVNEAAVASCDAGDRNWTKSRDEMAGIAAVARELLQEREVHQVRRLVLSRSYVPFLPARPRLSGVGR